MVTKAQHQFAGKMSKSTINERSTNKPASTNIVSILSSTAHAMAIAITVRNENQISFALSASQLVVEVLLYVIVVDVVVWYI